ncbi:MULTISPECIES: DUF2202 domain-containing protein [Gordonia]|uniref:DUF2202 domain-containing protein n=1 Tax=Gordonia amicalis TaxID=89053 RepID=A0AAE4R696_9ACTN|nr:MULTISPECIES: DUF2202 domain-containing protein [Gordonia]GAC51991.1 hypothetical protein GOAMI_06_00040 [Gordonia amicalis NBRC 100051 = JCM 11271]ATD72829.1 DUF2202 domain-containing protein [Gordonia sp. 1D]MBA5846052.1 DUF2202 domain-containing protein [Gordonia amicalis]MCZ4581306.1 DUF2202 domain-containing protein [Gordonia amicalis]MDJ0451958.1 DUF2202 domain-containing protein [Gordonia amicalis]
MNNWRRTVTALAAGATIAVAGFGAAVASAQEPDESAGGALSSQEQSDLVMMREEERLARDLYQQFAQQWGAQIFERISTSEQRHYDAVGTLLGRYGVSDPSAGLAAGTYSDPQLQSAYDGWLARGLASVEQAYAVGAELEAADITELTTAIEVSDEDAIDRVYGKLRTGSEHHLEAFRAALTGEEPAGGHSPGQGQKHGQGKGQKHGQGQGQKHAE